MTHLSTHRPRPHRRIAALGLIAASALAAGAVTAGAAPSGQAAAKRATVVQSFYSKQTSFVFTRADGKVVMPPPQQAAAGDRIEFTELGFRGTHAKHAKRWTISSHTICTFQAKGGPVCDGQAAIGGNQLLLFHTTDATGTRVSGGTGRYAGATGKVAMTEIEGSNDSDFVLTLNLKK
jgi:hypothetical protein